MKNYTQQELDRMGRSQLLQLVSELRIEIDECHMLLQDALDQLEANCDCGCAQGAICMKDEAYSKYVRG